MLRKYKPCIFDECTFSCEWWGGNQIFRNDGDIGKKKKKYLLKLNNQKIKDTFNWKPVWNIEKAVEKTVEWTKSYINNEDIIECTTNQINEYLKQKGD